MMMMMMMMMIKNSPQNFIYNRQLVRTGCADGFTDFYGAQRRCCTIKRLRTCVVVATIIAHMLVRSHRRSVPCIQ